MRTMCIRSIGRFNLLNFLLCHSALVDGQPVHRIKSSEKPLLLHVDTTTEGASPLLLSLPKPDVASKMSGAQKRPAPSGALLSKRSEVASSCWRATERPLSEKVDIILE